ncbi:2-deoxy-D-gluconate 3-dehydrogenase [Filimonas zeae]|uniref:2-deoxy-D-gluconate 3-dehydrogenase n=1 Tax=Filimonas zeae TaxID=1737353 RepID=A0A917INA7_9BACT|nr:SDR family NAD(P)-dependent oxidoreductase [Filimonas zeae]MDR6337226.1 2-deoxy-D-gluconate 3-dehydrogenase [Filimonas zeae]GGH57592.1 2-deoxy-D-gluconate 3-dehydrogenase [Filimonas zeae]
MSNTLFDLTGKTALVTGGNKGIGKGMAIGLAEAGADIIVVSGSIALEGSDVEKEVTALGRKFKAYQANLGDREKLYAFIEKLLAENTNIDILVNNAGTIMRKPAAEHPDEWWDSVLSLNLDAPFILAREIGKHMLQRGSGKIIFTCSLLSFQGGINVPGYAASKGALSSLVKALANEWAGKGINVNGIAPGYIATDNTEALRNDPVRSKSILDRIPAARWGEAEDFKGPAVFLASDAGAYVQGTILTVDGGWMGR